MNPPMTAAEMVELEAQVKQMMAEKAAYNAPYNIPEKPRTLTPEILERLREYEHSRNRQFDDLMVQQALQAAIHEVIHAIALRIINDRREEIEAACNFGELRDVLAAELARQFMAARLTGAATPFDPPAAGTAQHYRSPQSGGAGVGMQSIGQLLQKKLTKQP